MPQWGWGDYIKHRGRARAERQRRLNLNRERLKKVTGHSQSRMIRYPEHKDAFDYVHNLYPFAHVRSATVYQVPRSVSEDIGYKGAGGFFDIQSKIVVITDCVEVDEEPSPLAVKAILTPDEVLCHELIHYAANFKNPVSNRAVEEEIAYGKSIGYLRSKGRSDDDIIDNVMMPYLLSCVNVWQVLYQLARARNISMTEVSGMSEQQLSDRFGAQLSTACREEARRIGLAIVAQNTPKPRFDHTKTPAEEGDIKKAETRSKQFILDDDI